MVKIAYQQAKLVRSVKSLVTARSGCRKTGVLYLDIGRRQSDFEHTSMLVVFGSKGKPVS